jgi:BirA family biotin operon repressor/biotin-[acetyl-CoA-carboxylase] ligase
MEFNRISLFDVDSTNNYASNLMKSETLPHASVITAQFQTQGRGQRDNEWHGAANQNLMATWIFYFDHLKVANSFIYNQAVALALRSSISVCLGKDVYIKWPNDIIVQDKKIAGILIENNIQGDNVKSSLCGIGVNVLQLQFPVSNATSMRLAGSNIESVDSMLVIVHEQLLKHLEMLHNNPVGINSQYLQHLYQRGKTIEFLYKDARLVGQIIGVDDWGRLQIATTSQGNQVFQAGEIRCIWE